MDFIRYDDCMQAGIDDLTACFNEELLSKDGDEWAVNSKIAMENGSIFFDGSNYIDDKKRILYHP